MRKFVVNLVTLLEIVSIVGMSSFTTVAYAADELIDSKTSQDNVFFSATINNSNASAEANVEDGANLNLDVSVQNTGYLKDIKVTLNDSNYQINVSEKAEEKGSLYEVTDSNADTSNDVKEELTQETNSSSETENTVETSASTNTASTDLSTVVDVVENTAADLKNEAIKEKEESANSVANTVAASEGSISMSANTPNTNLVTNGNETVIPEKHTEEKIASDTDSEEASETNTLTTESSNLIKSISENTIELNEVNAGNSEKVSIPLSFRKLDKVSASEYSKDSTIDFEATYVNEKGKEKKIKKTINQKLTWKVNAEKEISQNLVRYLKYDSNTLVSFEVTDGIKDNSIPYTNKEIKITAPQVNGKAPVKAIVTGDNINYSYENGVVTINKENVADENGEYSFESKDTYMVTYIYNTQDASDSKTISETASAKVTTIKGDALEKKAESNDFAVNGEVGSIVELNVESPETLSKGYLYTNLNREDKLKTTFNETYKINVGLADLTDKITVNEKAYTLKNAENNTVKNAAVKTSKVSVNLDDLSKVLGEDGTITVKNGEGKELGTLRKGLSELTIDDDNLSFEISKPQAEGNIEISLEKYLASQDESFDEIKTYAKLQNEVEISSTKSDTKITDKNVEKEIKLEDPTSKATMYVSTDTLSTVVENRELVFNVVLNTSTINDALYKNPSIKITLPKDVTKIEVTDAKVFYDDEIKAGSFTSDKNVLTINLQGQETKYNTSAASTGALIRIVANVSLDNLAPSSEGDISLEYSNEFTGENNRLDGKINVVAPSGFVTTNTISIDGKEETALEDDVKNIEINIEDTSRKMTVSGKIVNNLGEDAEGAVLVGRIPFEGNKTENGEDLSSTITTKLASAINTDLPNAKVYYSENADEIIDGSSWTESFTNSAKSFKIVAGDTIKDKTISNFSYEVTLPKDLDYEKQASETYGVYYRNNSTEGEQYNLVQAKVATFTTGKKPDVTMEISAQDYNEGYAIDNDGKVTQGEKVLYKVKVTNNGSKDVQNVQLKINLSKNYVGKNNETIINSDNLGLEQVSESEFTKTIDELKVGETKTIEIPVKITGNLEGKISLKELGIDEGTTEISDEDFEKALENGKIVTTSFELNATGVSKVSKDFTVRETSGFASINLSAGITKLNKDDTASFTVNVTNTDKYAKDGVEIKIELPSELEFTGDTSTYTYNKDDNTVTKSVDFYQGSNSYNLTIPVKLVAETTKKLNVVATASYDGKEVKSNTLEFKNKANSTTVTAEQTTNIPNGSMLDTDSVEYYVQIKNDSDLDATVNFKDTLPQELRVTKVSLNLNGEETAKLATNYIIDTIVIPAKQTARYTITADAYTQYKSSDITIKNEPTIVLTNGDNVAVNSVSLKLNGTREGSASEESVDTTVTTSSSETEDTSSKLRSIFGTVWFDENNDGIKEENEQKLEGVKVSLLDNSTKEVAKDANGKELNVTTNSNGEYTFTNVLPGDYVIVAEYDNQKYVVGKYDAENSTSAENSNFVQTKLENKNVAASNTINITDANVYNENLALASNNIFNLSLDNTISKITVVNAKDSKQNKTYTYGKDIAKVELSTKDVESTTVLVEYKIRVSNIGKVAGYAKKIVDYIPAGFAFNADLNKDWYVENDGNAYTAKLANTLIEPGETKEVTLVLTKKMTGENIGTIRNTAEIAEDYNEYGLKDINSTVANKQDGEDDMKSANTIILMSAGRTRTAIFGITLGIAAIISYVVFKVKKDVIDKMYNYNRKI